MSKPKSGLAAGIVFILLGLVCVAAAVVALVFRLDDANATRPFLTDHTGVVMTIHQLANIVLPVGMLGGLGAIGYGAMRTRSKGDSGDED